MLVNGRWTHGGSGQSVEDVDPYTNEVLLQIPLADQADLDDAFEAAAAAQPAWSRARPATRAAVLIRAAAIMESRRA
jgi:aldehyde dehydrogenase (NAD+)